jgi:drug/metabolite transporter (DMT)-like permease
LRPERRPDRRGILLVAGAALLWSTGGMAIKALAEPPLKIAFYRCGIAAVALLLLLRPRVARWSAEFLVAIASYAACLITFVVATRWTTAANAIFLQYSGVVWVLLFSPVV